MNNSTQTVTRPVRSFFPTMPKPVKILHFRKDGAQYIGETEPQYPSVEDQQEWTHKKYESQLAVGFNWYAATQEDKDIIQMGLTALNLSGHFPELSVTINNSVLPLSLTAAKLLRMAHCGMYLRFHERRFIVRCIKKCLDNQKPIVEKAEGTAKPNIQEYVNAKLRRTKGEIDSLFDHFVECDYTYGGLKAKDTMNKKPLAVVANILVDPETTSPSNRAKDLIEYCQKYLDEYRAAYDQKMPFAEAYASLGKRKLKSAIEWWEQAIIDINVFSHHKQSMKKARARKPKSPSQLVAKLKFLKEFKELKLTSIDPTQVLKCSELWVYNTRLRKLGRYVSLNEMPFEVKSTRLINIDPLKSVQKTLRKPTEQLKEFSNYGKPGAVKWFNNIRAVATPLREAINGECILLKGNK